MSEELSDLDAAIDAQAAKPQSTSADGVSMQRRSLKELDEHYQAKANREAAASSTRLPFRLFNTSPPGAT